MLVLLNVIEDKQLVGENPFSISIFHVYFYLIIHSFGSITIK